MSRLFFSAICCIVLAALACRPAPDARTTQHPATPPVALVPRGSAPIDSTAIAFVRAFYTLYVPRGLDGGLRAVDSIVTERPSLFAPELLAGLRQDATARAAATEGIVGLDFDPFLNTQDGCERYETGEATRSPGAAAGAVRVSVYAVCRGVREQQPAVVVEVTPTGGSWALANFYYGPPTADDLRSMLRSLYSSPAIEGPLDRQVDDEVTPASPHRRTSTSSITS